ncbi:tripartite tricarboxylate transporter substrate binding protein [Treponema sp. OMZ 840]|uniref:tripartite tricarboxylate transporter substrate binding protein n=1 Tax=Treponema sp. OMZ 840 TaxID=244313 RepID=UPI003D8F3A70
MKKIGLIILCAVFIIISPVFAGGSSETSFPDPEKTITIVVPHSAGGSTDRIFRALIEELKKTTGQNFIVTNIPGAGSATGTNEVINGTADGYTLLGAGTHTTAATMQGLTEGYKALDHIAALNWDPFIIAVRTDKPWKTLKELEAAAKANPGKISFGNAGMGGATGVASVGINLALNKIFNVTPFNGGADLIASVLGGHCDVGIFSQSEVKANKDSLRPLAILGEKHSTIPELAQVPTISEAGYPGVSIPGGSFRSLMVKKGTPDNVKKWLAEAVEKAFYSDGFQKFMKANGFIQAFHKLDDFAAYDAGIIADYEPILKEAGLYKMK